jgi:formylglycine-generating enzyme required for sulfatase activity
VRMHRPSPALQEMTQELETVRVNADGSIAARWQVNVKVLQQALPDGLFLDLVSIPAGTFSMGSPHSQGHRDEEPQHLVRIDAFVLSQTTITQRQWKSVMGKVPPCRGKSLDHSVDRVSWFEAQRFCQRLSKLTGRSYRLPSEAEWEYACRAGSSSDFAFGEMITTELANYVGLYPYQEGPVGTYRHGPVPPKGFPPNGLGLYDMHGNLDEWCSDTWHEDYVGAPLTSAPWTRGGSDERVIRGGSWHDPPVLCRSAARLKLSPSEGEDFVGVRVALAADEG